MKNWGQIISGILFCLGGGGALSAENPPVIKATALVAPVIKGISANPMVRLAIYVPEGNAAVEWQQILLSFNGNAARDLDSVQVYNQGAEPNFSLNRRGESAAVTGEKMQLSVDVSASPGYHYIWIAGKLKAKASLDGSIELHVTGLVEKGGRTHTVVEEGTGFVKRKAIAIRKAGDGGVHTFRIPGMVQTSKGTLVAVYDIRYTTTQDLPGNIDVGMSRSTDGGETWEPMKVIMDMGAPHENNGVGDPAIVFDPVRNKLLVAALWSKGNRSIAGSGPGFSADETGQLVISESTDDGVSWTAPISITQQVKDSSWLLFFQGPGNGMVMKNGTIVFAAQYWDPSRIPHSTIIYSVDGGKNWQRGTGAKANTTEAQAIETSEGKIMLSMRDNRGGYRTVSTTKDLGKTWTEHITSSRALPDPVCMAGFTKERVMWKGRARDIVFFSNPATSIGRYNISIKASDDLAESWQYKLLVDERMCYGYSVMCKTDNHTIGLLYEGSRDLYFIRIPVKDIQP